MSEFATSDLHLPAIAPELTALQVSLLDQLDPHHALRGELLAAGVAPKTACALYPLNQFVAEGVANALAEVFDHVAPATMPDFDRWLAEMYAHADALHKALAQPWAEIWLDACEDFAFRQERHLSAAVDRWLTARQTPDGTFLVYGATASAAARHRSTRIAMCLWCAAAFLACSTGLPEENTALRYFDELTSKLLAPGAAW